VQDFTNETRFTSWQKVLQMKTLHVKARLHELEREVFFLMKRASQGATNSFIKMKRVPTEIGGGLL
jgi:hypothetical protein